MTRSREFLEQARAEAGGARVCLCSEQGEGRGLWLLERSHDCLGKIGGNQHENQSQ